MATRICSTRAWNRARGKFKKKWRENDDNGLLQNLIRVWLVILDDRQRHKKNGSTSWDGDVDAEISVVGEQLRDRGVEDQAVRVHDGWRDSFVDGPRRGLPRQAAAMAVQFQPEIRTNRNW